MEKNKMLEADYLDIIFDKRNKNYGGYELRRNYNRRIRKAGMFVVLGLSALISFSFISTKERHTVADIIYDKNTKLTDVVIPEKPPIEPPKPPTAPPPPMKSELNTVPIVTKDDVKPEEMMAEAKKLENSNSGLSHNDSGIIDNVPSKIPGNGPVVAIVTPPPPTKLPTFVEQMPEYKGNLNAYLSDNIQYPEQAKAAGIQGRVAVEFVVNEDGAITNVRIVRSIGAGCDEEALRVIKSMPKWKPGKQNGTPVKVMITQPITFKLTQ